MTQGDERMKAAKTSIRQRLTHSKLPMLVLVGVVLFALIFLGMRFSPAIRAKNSTAKAKIS